MWFVSRDECFRLAKVSGQKRKLDGGAKVVSRTKKVEAKWDKMMHYLRRWEELTGSQAVVMTKNTDLRTYLAPGSETAALSLAVGHCTKHIRTRLNSITEQGLLIQEPANGIAPGEVLAKKDILYMPSEMLVTLPPFLHFHRI